MLPIIMNSNPVIFDVLINATSTYCICNIDYFTHVMHIILVAEYDQYLFDHDWYSVKS